MSGPITRPGWPTRRVSPRWGATRLSCTATTWRWASVAASIRRAMCAAASWPACSRRHRPTWPAPTPGPRCCGPAAVSTCPATPSCRAGARIPPRSPHDGGADEVLEVAGSPAGQRAGPIIVHHLCQQHQLSRGCSPARWPSGRATRGAEGGRWHASDHARGRRRRIWGPAGALLPILMVSKTTMPATTPPTPDPPSPKTTAQTRAPVTKPAPLGLVGAGDPGPGADADRVPGVDGDEEADQRGDLLRAEFGSHLLVGLGRDVRISQPGHRFGKGQRGALAGGEVRGFLPGGQPVQALLGLADRARVLGVHVDAVGAAVELGGADPDQLAEPGVDLGGVEFLGRGLVQM